MPDITPKIGVCSLPNDLAAGTSSSTESEIIIPATTARSIPNKLVFRKGININAATAAPAGSLKFDKKDLKNVFFLFPVDA